MGIEVLRDFAQCEAISNKRRRDKVFHKLVSTPNDLMGVYHDEHSGVLDIVFSGTKNLRAWLFNSGNADFFNDDGTLEEHDAHNGFSDSADLFDRDLYQLLPVIRNCAQVRVKGHSRGGPMGMHAVLQLREYGVARSLLRCLTFGSPAPGREGFKLYWVEAGCELERYRAGDDLVPLVGTETMGAVHPVAAVQLQAPRWTYLIPSVKVSVLPFEMVRCGVRGVVHHAHFVYRYGLKRLYA